MNVVSLSFDLDVGPAFCNLQPQTRHLICKIHAWARRCVSFSESLFCKGTKWDQVDRSVPVTQLTGHEVQSGPDFLDTSTCPLRSAALLLHERGICRNWSFSPLRAPGGYWDNSRVAAGRNNFWGDRGWKEVIGGPRRGLHWVCVRTAWGSPHFLQPLPFHHHRGTTGCLVMRGLLWGSLSLPNEALGFTKNEGGPEDTGKPLPLSSNTLSGFRETQARETSVTSWPLWGPTCLHSVQRPGCGVSTSICSFPAQTSSPERVVGCLKDEMRPLHGVVCPKRGRWECVPHIGSPTLAGVQIKRLISVTVYTPTTREVYGCVCTHMHTHTQNVTRLRRQYWNALRHK